MTTMPSISVYREHAEMCLRVAARLKSEAEKAVLLSLAEEWRRIAAEVEINLLTCEPHGHA
jgi:hypothetical protein